MTYDSLILHIRSPPPSLLLVLPLFHRCCIYLSTTVLSPANPLIRTKPTTPQRRVAAPGPRATDGVHPVRVQDHRQLGQPRGHLGPHRAPGNKQSLIDQVWSPSPGGCDRVSDTRACADRSHVHTLQQCWKRSRKCPPSLAVSCFGNSTRLLKRHCYACRLSRVLKSVVFLLVRLYLKRVLFFSRCGAVVAHMLVPIAKLFVRF